MQTKLADFVKERPDHEELENILRACVHCGFCNATCPTYQLLGDERDGPRGRIYLLKAMFEGAEVSELTQRHLDRCLNCLSCETTCPSGVRYGRLLDLGRVMVEKQAKRSGFDRLRRFVFLQILPYRRRFGWALQLAHLCRPVLPAALRVKLPARLERRETWPTARHRRKMLILQGCVQGELAPSIDIAAARVLDTLGISLLSVAGSGCCGALPYHLSAHEKAREMARRNIDACWPYLQQGAEVVVMTASGCGVIAKDYRDLLQNDPNYREKAYRFSTMVKDISEVLSEEDLSCFQADHRKIVFQSPCTLQHGQRLNGLVESLLQRIGYRLTPVPEGHLCCGSAGTYSLLQADLAESLRDEKLQHLQAGQPDLIATANIGCLIHLRAATRVKVSHWIELLK